MKNKKEKTIGIGLLFLEVALLFALFSFIPSEVMAVVGTPDADVMTWLEVGNVYPDILNISINDDTQITLTPNATTTISCVAVIRDYNGDSDISNVTAIFYEESTGSAAIDDHNNHYTNTSCELIADTGNFNLYADDEYHSLANCTFEVEYYADAGNWECNITAIDNMTWYDTQKNNQTMLQLLAIGLPDLINYSKVNATFVSDEQIANITNFGNTKLNVTIESYAVTLGDGLAMNCSLGIVQNISSMYEKYNVTNSTPVVASLTDFELTYVNTTNLPVNEGIELISRTDDLPGGESIQPTYWRIYVPRGVAGNCTGNIRFGATTL